MSEGIEILISADDQASAKLKEVSDNMDKAAKQQVAAFREIGGRAKGATEFVGVLASLTGNSELAGYAGQIAQVTEKAGQFSEIQKAGGAGALAFKGGIAALVGTLAFGLGKTLGDVIFKTEKFNRAMAESKRQSEELTSQISRTQSREFSQRKEDIELISDPGAKQAAQQQFLEELNRDIAAVSANVRQGKKEVEEWASRWKITGNQKAFAEMASEELENDRKRLAVLTDQRQELIAMTSERERQNEALRAENAAKERSGSYVENLRREVEYLRATREEQIQLDAKYNTVGGDSPEAERLLKERDALLAKAEAEKKAEEERRRSAEKAEQDRDRQARYIEERDRRRKEIHEREEERKRVAWNEEVEREEQQREKLAKDPSSLQATQGRLLTRGSGMDASEKANEERRRQLAELDKKMQLSIEAQNRTATALEKRGVLEVELIS